jgi:hypothetical protein
LGFGIEQVKTAEEILKDTALPATVKQTLQSWQDEATKYHPKVMIYQGWIFP